MGTQSTLVEVLERFAETMAGEFEINDVLYELGDSTVDVLDAAGAGVSVVNDHGQLLFVTATSESVIEIERSQERNQDGPCVEAFSTGEVVAVGEIDGLERWPEYESVAHASGVAAVVGVPLAIGDRRIGSLNVYDTRRRDWNDDDLRTARVIADIATAYIVRSGDLEQARRLSEQLQQALDSRVVIEQAKGMLARDHHISVDQAFELLRDHSRRHGRPLRGLADAIVNLGLELPPQQ